VNGGEEVIHSFSNNAGVVHETVNRAQSVDRSLHAVGDGPTVAYVHLDDLRSTASFLDDRLRLRCRTRFHVEDDDVRACLGDAVGDSPTDPLCCSSHDDVAVL
jgi:hypothetical protein